MRVVFHPEFPEDIKRFEAQYQEISDRLAARFRAGVDEAIERIKAAPNSAGHFVNTGSQIVKEVRRRNLTAAGAKLDAPHRHRLIPSPTNNASEAV